MINFEEDIDATTLDNTTLHEISSLAITQVELEAQLETAKQYVKTLTEQLRRVSEDLLPARMAEVGMASFKLADGKSVTVRPHVYPSIPADKREFALNWLKDNGHGSIIKNTVSVQFGKGDDQKAEDLAGLLFAEGYVVRRVENVHAQTLKAFVTEMLGDGQELPEDLFNVHQVNRAIIK